MTRHSAGPATEGSAEREVIGGTADAVIRQASILLGGFGAAQVCSFLRNAVVGHTLSQSDFGIAATIALTLQMAETLTDLNSDRLIIQAKDGSSARFVASAHTIAIVRGALISMVLLFAAGPAAAFFSLPQAVLTFQLAAFCPFIKSFMHLDYRRDQRCLDNRSYVAIEVLPQMAALALTLPILAIDATYNAVIWLSIGHAMTSVAVSHLLAKRPYGFGFNSAYLRRHIAFGWPILASGLPLVAVFQADRMVIGRVLGMDAIAAYSVAFMVTMVPAVIVSKVCHALILPLLSQTVREGRSLSARFTSLSEAVCLFAAVYLAIFCMAGETLVPLAFGPNYAGLGEITALLALMFAIRMTQAVPGMALMAFGDTQPFFMAGVIRAHALPVVVAIAALGGGLGEIAAVGVIFECLSLAYIAYRLNALEAGIGRIFAERVCFIAPAGAGAFVVAHLAPASPFINFGMILVACAIIVATGLAAMPALRQQLRQLAVGHQAL